MGSQPDQSFPAIALPSLSQSGPPPASPNNRALLIWALQNYPSIGAGAGALEFSEAPSVAPTAGPIDPSIYQVEFPSLPSLSDAAAQFDPWHDQTDWRPSQPNSTDASDASDIRFHKAQPGESISGILGTPDPGAVGEFMQLNGLSSTRIDAGRTY